MQNLLTFTQFVDRTGARRALIAERLGVTVPAIDKLYGGTMLPSLDLALKIQELTLGTVTCESWVENTKNKKLRN